MTGFAMAAVLVAVGTAQGGDLVTFLRMISVAGPGAEANPLVAAGIQTIGVPGLVLTKLALIGFVVLVFGILARRHAKTARFVVGLATLAGLIGAYSNVVALG